MRTTVDLPPAVHRRASELAKARGVSLSATVAELTAQGLGQLDEPLVIHVSERTGLPYISRGRGPVTSEDVARLIDEDE